LWQSRSWRFAVKRSSTGWFVVGVPERAQAWFGRQSMDRDPESGGAQVLVS
jgi:hypothetical protein